MNTAAKVALHKQQKPERYCPVPRCLWHVAKLNAATGEYTYPKGRYCPRHKHLARMQLPGTADKFNA